MYSMCLFVIITTTTVAIASALTVDLSLASCPNVTALNTTQAFDGDGDDFLPINASDGPIFGVEVVAASPDTSFETIICLLVAPGDKEAVLEQVATPQSPYFGDQIGWVYCYDNLDDSNSLDENGSS